MKKDSTSIDTQALASRRQALQARFDEAKARGLALDMTRGKPCAEQLDLSNGLLDTVTSTDHSDSDGDTRNYGGIDGMPAAKALFADYMGVTPGEIIIGGNSSLNMMHDLLRDAWVQGFADSEDPWSRLPEVKFLCPSPGYDRHFTICEYFGIEMVAVPMNADGPDMDEVERLAGSDPAFRGMWVVPRYSNPTGVTCSDEVVQRLARMKTAARDFRILWDDAYAVHDLGDEPDRLLNLLDECKRAGNGNRVVMFGSTSKISFAGAGVAMLAASEPNIEEIRKRIGTQSIGPDKINQLRHVRFFGDMDGIRAHMKKQAAIIRPKFDIVLDTLERELGGSGVAEWSRPNGGYFVSVDTLDGCARRTVALAAEAGVKLTPAGASFPYGRDPRDRNIRLAPTFPKSADVQAAMDIFCLAVLLASIEKLCDSEAA